MLNEKFPEPSTKNGRRSAKNVSNAPRLTTAGSASTWPKSGLIVPVSVRPPIRYLRSRPAATLPSGDDRSGLPGATGADVIDDERYGSNSSRFAADGKARPVSSPNEETKPLALRASSGHVEVSFTCATVRITAKPNVPAARGSKRSCENGTRNSAVQ